MIQGLPDSLMSNLSQTRNVSVTISYNGQDISSVIQSSNLDLIYKESFKQNVQADTLDVKIADPEGLFRQSFTLDSYAEVDCTISISNWSGPGSGTAQKQLSKMYVQSFNVSQDKHSGTTIRLKCTSIPPQSPLRLEKKSQSFPTSGTEQATTTLKDIATQVAGQDGFALQYTATRNPVVQRADQHDHSDSYMLQKLCRENDFVYNSKNKTIYITDMKTVESASALGTIMCPSKAFIGGWNNNGIIKWEYTETVEDIYGSAETSYVDPRTGKVVTGTATDPKQPAGAPKLIDHNNPHDDGSASKEIKEEGDTDQSNTGQGD